MSDLLERTIARVRRRDARADQSAGPAPQLSAAAFRAVAEERLRNLERQLDEVRSRVNGLIFLLAGAVAAQLLLGLFG